jgi:ABC-2 type transport system permease protein
VKAGIRPGSRPRAYAAFAALAFAREATYRFDVFTNVASVAIRLYLLKMVWTALYAHNAAPAALSLHAVVTYSAVALLMGLVMDIDQTRALHDRLHDGSIVTDFLRPVVVPFAFFADGTGEVLFHAALIVPALAVALLIVHVDVPSLATCAAFGASFLLGYFIGFCLNFILNCTAFWTLEISAVQSIVTWLTGLLGGEVIPLAFFPDSLQHAVGVLPFAAMFSTPLSIYVGTIPPSGYAAALAVQAAWLAVFALAATAMWRAGARRIVVQGG